MNIVHGHSYNHTSSTIVILSSVFLHNNNNNNIFSLQQDPLSNELTWCLF